MKIATYNVNSINARLDLVKMWLARSNIDILCIQELKCETNKFPYAAFEELGYTCEVCGQKQYNGVAICSKIPFSSVKTGINNENDDQKRAIYAKIKDFNLLNLYIPHGALSGDKHQYKLDFFEDITNFIVQNKMRSEKTIIVGDLNIAHNDIDVYDPKYLSGTIGFMNDERRKLTEFLKNNGLTDFFRYKYNDVRQFSWWGYMGGAIWQNNGMRLDYILLNDRALLFAADISIDMWPRKRRSPTPSDHTPVVTEFLDNF